MPYKTTKEIVKVKTLTVDGVTETLPYPIRIHYLDDDSTIFSSDSFSLRFLNPVTEKDLSEFWFRYKMELEEKAAKAAKQKEKKLLRKSERPPIRRKQ